MFISNKHELQNLIHPQAVIMIAPGVDTNELMQARLMAGITRRAAAHYLNVQEYTYNEREMNGVRSTKWVKKLKKLHVPIDINGADGKEVANTPDGIRELRLRAGLTKPEASRSIGVSVKSTWHAYETGRASMPDDRFSLFKHMLKTGGFRVFFLGNAYRTGPCSNKSFAPGQSQRGMSRLEREACKAHAHLVVRTRMSLGYSARSFAAQVGVSQASVYAMEKGKGRLTSRILTSMVSMLIPVRALETLEPIERAAYRELIKEIAGVRKTLISQGI